MITLVIIPIVWSVLTVLRNGNVRTEVLVCGLGCREKHVGKREEKYGRRQAGLLGEFGRQGSPSWDHGGQWGGQVLNGKWVHWALLPHLPWGPGKGL